MSDLTLVLPLPEPDLAALPLDLLRAHRRELVTECIRAARWRRLVQARLDLAVDLAAPTEDLRAPAGDDPDGRCAGLRATIHACALTALAGGGDAVSDLRRVEAARTALASYAATLDRRLAAATEELVGRYSAEPGSALGALDVDLG